MNERDLEELELEAPAKVAEQTPQEEREAARLLAEELENEAV